jgi:hydroxymethylpyrimidine/phosphomethylpyrimidine kinase
MLSDAEIIRAIRDQLLGFGAENVVIDPVMVSKSGYRLLREDAVEALREFVSTADIVTPNIPEAELLCGFPIKTASDMSAAAEKIAAAGAKNVLIKGGHRIGNDAGDLLLADGDIILLPAKRIETKNTHGTGCTLSSAIASRLALGDAMVEAVRAAKEYITQAISDSYPVGKGVGPVGHMSALYRKAKMEVTD